ncbi:hypothetical protein C8F01DRAFT_1265548 [Mycena amicta]|nr:hypothetical protein C8F01DRAFT_1265548 [Mycena amicta]
MRIYLLALLHCFCNTSGTSSLDEATKEALGLQKEVLAGSRPDGIAEDLESEGLADPIEVKGNRSHTRTTSWYGGIGAGALRTIKTVTTGIPAAVAVGVARTRSFSKPQGPATGSISQFHESTTEEKAQVIMMKQHHRRTSSLLGKWGRASGLVAASA